MGSTQALIKNIFSTVTVPSIPKPYLDRETALPTEPNECPGYSLYPLQRRRDSS